MNIKYLAKRLGFGAVVAYLVATFSFAIVYFMPGSMEDYMHAMQSAGGGGAGQVTVTYGLGEGSLWEQYTNYMGWLAAGNLGYSDWYREPVADILGQALPWTLFVMSQAIFFTFLIGIVFGAILAYYESSRFDVVGSSIATILNSIPYYVAALFFLFFLGFHLGWFPTSGQISRGVEPGFNLEFITDALYHSTLPVASFVITAFGMRALQMRGNSISVLGSNYVRVANLRGLSDRTISLRYVARNAVLPLYTGLMIWLGFAFGGAIVLEEIFTYPGIGFYMYQAIVARDVPLMMGAFMLIAIAVLAGLIIADLTYGLIDPRAASSSRESDRSLADIKDIMVLKILYWKNSIPQKLSRSSSKSPEIDSEPLEPLDDDIDVDVSSFEVTAEKQLTRRERYEQMYREYVVAPVKIILGDRRAVLGLAIIGLFVFLGTIGVRLYPEPSTNQAPRLMAPFEMWAHPLGSDQAGRDLLGDTIHATPAILKMVFAGSLFGAFVGTAVGVIAGYAGGVVERLLTGAADTILAIPALPLVMVLAIAIEPSSPYVVGIILTIPGWGGTARQIHSQTLALMDESYVEASRVMQIPRRTIWVKDILPNIMPFVFIKTVQMGRSVIFSAVALYFLGVLPFTSGTHNWGVTMNTAYQNGALYQTGTFHWIAVPMFAIVLFTYGLILFAQGTDQMFNAKVRARHAGKIEEEEEPEQPSRARPQPGD